jgi:hypothetical protein
VIYKRKPVGGVIFLKVGTKDVQLSKIVTKLANSTCTTSRQISTKFLQQLTLFETAAIELEVPLRSNQKEQKPVMSILKKVILYWL